MPDRSPDPARELQLLVFDVAGRLARAPARDISDVVGECQERVGKLLDLAESAFRPLEDAATDGFPWSRGQLARGDIVAVPRVADLPRAAARDQAGWRGAGIESALIVPAAADSGPPTGALWFGAAIERDWPRPTVELLTALGQVIAQASLRMETEIHPAGPAERLLDWVVDASNDWIFSADADTFRLASYNRAFVDYYTTHRRFVPALGAAPEDFLPPDVAQRWHGFFRRAKAEGTFTTEYPVYGGDRRLRLSFHFLPARHLIYMIGKDITDEVARGAQLEQRMGELEEATRAITELQARTAERQRLAYEAHDTIVQGVVAAETLYDLGEAERARSVLDLVSRAARTWIGELLEGAVLHPGAARRMGAAGRPGGEP